jgi:hypothetical protein
VISKERLNEIALEVALPVFGKDFAFVPDAAFEEFAHALLKAVEQELSEDAPVHIYPWDLERFEGEETFCTVFSIPVGCPDGKSVPLIALPLVESEE